MLLAAMLAGRKAKEQFSRFVTLDPKCRAGAFLALIL